MNSSALPGLSTKPVLGNDVRCAGVSSALVLVSAALIAPLAYWQLSSVGLMVIAAAALTVVFAILLSLGALRYFSDSNSPIAGLLIAMCARMFVPLMFVVAIIVWNAASVPSWSAMYIAPLYFVMLIAETAFALRRCQFGPSTRPRRTIQVSQMAIDEG